MVPMIRRQAEVVNRRILAGFAVLRCLAVESRDGQRSDRLWLYSGRKVIHDSTMGARSL